MNPPKMPIHIGDLLRDTGHLRALGMGAYLLLMFHYWSTGALPDDDDQLSAIARMTPTEWRKAKPVIGRFFDDGWKHGRIDFDLGKASGISDSAREAGKASGRSRSVKRSLNGRSSTVEPTLEPLKKDSEASASGAEAPIDHRKRLFNEGLSKLGTMTGKGPDACRSFVGKCLKAASDDAIVVLGLIEDAERNQVVDPSAWIAARLKTPENGHGKPKSAIIQAADNLVRRLASFDGPARCDDELRGDQGEASTRLLSHG